MNRWERFIILRSFGGGTDIRWEYNMQYRDVTISVRTKDNRGVRMREPETEFPSEELIAKLTLLLG